MAKKQTKVNKPKKIGSKPRRRWPGLLFKLCIVGFVVLAGYMVYLDAQIKHTFTGNKWEVPAQIFARPLVLSEALEITPKEVLDELKLLGYRKVTNPDSSGEYRYTGNKLVVQRRAFSFPDGDEPLRQITITWQGSRISSIRDDSAGISLPKTSNQFVQDLRNLEQRIAYKDSYKSTN